MMSKSQELEHTSSDTQIIEEDSPLQTTQQIANIQNNFHFSQTIDIDKLTLVASINLPVLAGIGITIPISFAVANMLGFKASSQKLSKKELQELEENQTDNER